MHRDMNRDHRPSPAVAPVADAGKGAGFDPEVLSQRLQSRIIGQPDAVHAVVRAISIAHVGVADPGRPLSSLLLVGPTGVGKTELVRQVAAVLRTGPDDLCRIDMNALAQEHYAASLSGAPPGYAGSKESFTLFDKEKIEGGPYLPGIALFDEIEKADPTVIRALMHILDTGELRLANGQEKISFRNCYIFLTSNLGSREVAENQRARGRSPVHRLLRARRRPHPLSAQRTREIVRRSTEEFFDPEFFNRIDETVVFDAFVAHTAEAVTRREIDELIKRLRKRRVILEVDPSVIDHLQRRGFDPVYGARGLRRAIRNELVGQVAQCVLHIGTTPQHPLPLHARVDNGAVSVTVQTSNEGASPASSPGLHRS